MGLEPRALQLTRSCCPEGPHAACSRSSRTGSELSATGFRPIWTHGGNGLDPMGCTERPRAACEGRALSGPPILASLPPQWLQNILGQVLDALDYLHHLDLIHR